MSVLPMVLGLRDGHQAVGELSGTVPRRETGTRVLWLSEKPWLDRISAPWKGRDGAGGCTGWWGEETG